MLWLYVLLFHRRSKKARASATDRYLVIMHLSTPVNRSPQSALHCSFLLSSSYQCFQFCLLVLIFYHWRWTFWALASSCIVMDDFAIKLFAPLYPSYQCDILDVISFHCQLRILITVSVIWLETNWVYLNECFIYYMTASSHEEWQTCIDASNNHGYFLPWYYN